MPDNQGKLCENEGVRAEANFMTVTRDLMQEQSAQILIVDDTPANLELLVGMLQHCGYRLKVAVNGRMALDVAKIKPPDLILMDICLPEMDGYEVCRCFKNDFALNHIPVIFVSALASADEKIKAFESGWLDRRKHSIVCENHGTG